MTKAKWTFMVYLAGDNNLAPAADIDLGEMRTVGSSKDVNITAQVDWAEGQGSMRYCIQCDGIEKRAEPLGETDPGDPKRHHAQAGRQCRSADGKLGRTYRA